MAFNNSQICNAKAIDLFSFIPYSFMWEVLLEFLPDPRNLYFE